MNLPPEILQLAPEEAVRRIAMGFLADARAALERLDDPDDAEALHAFRVAVRRLRSTARLWKAELRRSVGGRDRRTLRALQKATGTGRDAEVALAWLATQEPTLPDEHRPGLAWIEEHLGERRRQSVDSAREDLKRSFARLDRSLSERLPRLRFEVDLSSTSPPPRFANALAGRLRSQVRDLAKRLGRIDSIHDEDACHRARISCKRLRYLIEPVSGPAKAGGLVKQCKKLQDLLGDLNDCHVLSVELGHALQETEAEHVRELHALTRLDPAGLRAERAQQQPRPGDGLLELTRRAGRRAQQRFGHLEREWLEDGVEQLLDEVESVATRLEEAGRPPVEVERKYLLDGLPDLTGLRARGIAVEVLEIRQGWLPGRDLRERIRRTRVRESGDGARAGSIDYRRTMKLGQGIERIEIEEATTETVFDALWPLTDGCRIRKHRWRVREGDYVWEVDEFLDRPLVLAEVELDDPGERPDFPAWLEPYVVREVTDDPLYTNFKLAR